MYEVNFCECDEEYSDNYIFGNIQRGTVFTYGVLTDNGTIMVRGEYQLRISVLNMRRKLYLKREVDGGLVELVNTLEDSMGVKKQFLTNGDKRVNGYEEFKKKEEDDMKRDKTIVIEWLRTI
ncbi:hypothetical protein Tco_0808587 [Tanacetum coccineum]